VELPEYVREVVEEVAFQARADKKVDKRSGVSQRMPITSLENVISNAERRALLGCENLAVPRVSDIYTALPSITGKFELEYEGELKGADAVARELVRAAVANVFNGYLENLDARAVVDWFDSGGSLQLSDTTPAAEVLKQAKKVSGLLELVRRVAAPSGEAPAPVTASAVDFVLEGLYSLKKIARSDERGYHSADASPSGPRRGPRPAEQMFDEGVPLPGKKKYYN
jgi:magnesium chelatase subunit I